MLVRVVVGAMAALLCVAPCALADPVDVSVVKDSGTGEPEIEVSPKDPETIVVGKNDKGVAVSHDRGRTFKQVDLENPGDHVLTAGPDGTFFYSALDGDVRMSSDNGDTWKSVGNWVGAVAAQAHELASSGAVAVAGREAACSAPEEAGGPGEIEEPGEGPGPHLIGCGRPWLYADKTPAPLYVSFVAHDESSGAAGPMGWELRTLSCRSTVNTNPAFECGRQYVSASHDRGKTWSRFLPLDSADHPAGSTGGFSTGPVAAGGVLASAYIAASAPRGATCPCIVFETSRDDGLTFNRHVVAKAPLPPALGNVEGGEQSALFEPYLAGDPVHPGHYAVMIGDADFSHLLVWTTRDSGETWEGPARLADSSGARRHLPWLAIGPTGALGAVWRTTRSDDSYSVWAAVAPRGDADFAPPVRLSSAVSPGPVQQLAGDDASDVALDATDLHAAWGDRWDGSLGIRYGRYAFAGDPPVAAIAAAPTI